MYLLRLLFALSLLIVLPGCPEGTDDDDSAADDDDAANDDDAADDDDATDDDDAADDDDATDDDDAADDDDDSVGDDDDSASDDDDSASDDDDSASDDDDSALDPAATDDDGDGMSENDGDCDDTDANNFPGNVEDCFDGQDNDCDSVIDRAELGSQYLEVTMGYAEWAGGAGYDYITGLTFEAFVRLNTGTTVADNRILWHKGADYAILDLYGPTGPNAPAYAPQLELNINGTAGTTVSQTSTPTGSWHHVAAAYDLVAGQVTYYLDGADIGTHALPNGPLAPFSPTGAIYIGGQNTLASVVDVDDVRSWNVVRTAQEIQENLCAPVAASTPGLQFNFDFEGVNLDAANSVAGTGNTIATGVALASHTF